MTAPTFRPGDRITWTHYARDGHAVVRSGRVGDQAPAVAGTSRVWWVIPDQPAPGDLYDRLPVGKRYGGRPGVQGMLFSDDAPTSPLGRLTVESAESARRARAARWACAEGGAS